jgi:hypothetical protein
VTPREKKRRQRARERRGEAVLRVTVQEHELVEALIVSGRLTEGAALDRHEVEEAVGKVLQVWAKRWLDEI